METQFPVETTNLADWSGKGLVTFFFWLSLQVPRVPQKICIRISCFVFRVRSTGSSYLFLVDNLNSSSLEGIVVPAESSLEGKWTLQVFLQGVHRIEVSPSVCFHRYQAIFCRNLSQTLKRDGKIHA